MAQTANGTQTAAPCHVKFVVAGTTIDIAANAQAPASNSHLDAPPGPGGAGSFTILSLPRTVDAFNGCPLNIT